MEFFDLEGRGGLFWFFMFKFLYIKFVFINFFSMKSLDSMVLSVFYCCFN